MCTLYTFIAIIIYVSGHFQYEFPRIFLSVFVRILFFQSNRVILKHQKCIHFHSTMFNRKLSNNAYNNQPTNWCLSRVQSMPFHLSYTIQCIVVFTVDVDVDVVVVVACLPN